jgi:Domain of unknown function (DUF4190)
MSQPGPGWPPPGGEQPYQPYGQQQPPYGGYPQYGGTPTQYGQQPYQQYGPQPYGYGYGYPQPQVQPGNGIAVASLVCGILGVLLFGIFGMFLGPLALVFGAVGISRANRGASGKGLAIAGLVMGCVATAVSVVLLAAITNNSLLI